MGKEAPAQQANLEFSTGHETGPGQALFVTINSLVSVLSCGADGKVVLRDCSLQEKASCAVGVFGVQKRDLRAIAVNPVNGQALVAHDRKVKLLHLSKMEFDLEDPPGGSFPLPMRAVACSPDGKLWAMASDSNNVKLCNVSDGLVKRSLQDDGLHCGVAWDPANEYVAAVQNSGTLLVWEVNNSTAVHKSKAIRKVDVKAPIPIGISWHPDGGTLLALPGQENDIIVYERLSWDQTDFFTGGHDAPVVCVSYSPNGMYLASGDEQGRVCVWDTKTRQVLASGGGKAPAATGGDGGASIKEAAVISLSWHPTGNALLIMTMGGKICVWDGCVPVSPRLPGPAVPIDELNKMDLDGDEGPATHRRGGDDADDGDEALDGVGNAGGEDDTLSLNDFIVQDSSMSKGKAAARSMPPPRMALPPRPAPPKELPLQKPFQPCSTPASGTSAQFLAYTRMGCLTSRPLDDNNVVEVTFHDHQRLLAVGGRVPPITDYFGCTHGCLGERGVLLGSPAKRDQASMIMYSSGGGGGLKYGESIVGIASRARCSRIAYRPFESWAPSSDWQFGLPEGESVACLAAGASFSAAATSAQLLRLFSPAGLQLAIVTLPGAPVAMAAQGHNLAVVTVAGPPSHNLRAQNLWITVYDAETTSCTLSCSCPLTPGSSLGSRTQDEPPAPVTTLQWLGFSDKGAVVFADSTGAMQLRSPLWGGCWVPVYRMSDHVKAGETYWPVAVHGSELLTIMLPPSSQHPQVSPAPYLTPLPLRQPALHKGDKAEEQLEGDLLMATLMLGQTRESCPASAGGILASTLSAAERGADAAALKVLQASLKAGRHARAHDAANCLQLLASLEGALRLANHHKATGLAERIAATVQARLDEEAMAAAAEEQHAFMGLAGAAMTPIPMKGRNQQGDAAPQDGNAGGEQVAPGSAGPPSTGGGALTALKKAAAAVSPALTGQENALPQKRKPGTSQETTKPLNNPFARRPTKQPKA